MSDDKQDQNSVDAAWEDALAEQQGSEAGRKPEASDEASLPEEGAAGAEAEQDTGQGDASDGDVDQDAMAEEWARAMEEQGDEEGVSDGGAAAEASDAGDAEAAMMEAEQQREAERQARREADEARREQNWQAEKAELDELQPDAGPNLGDEEANLEVIMDIPVTLSMEIGRTQISIRHLLQLNQGSVVELDRLAGEPLDVMVNGTLIAHGEVVVVNERFGIRLTDVISAAERVKKLR